MMAIPSRRVGREWLQRGTLVGARRSPSAFRPDLDRQRQAAGRTSLEPVQQDRLRVLQASSRLIGTWLWRVLDPTMRNRKQQSPTRISSPSPRRRRYRQPVYGGSVPAAKIADCESLG